MNTLCQPFSQTATVPPFRGFSAEMLPEPCRSPLIVLGPADVKITDSSMDLGWDHVLVEKHVLAPGSRPHREMNWHVVSQLRSRAAHVEHNGSGERWQSCRIVSGMVSCMPPGRVPELRLHQPMEVLHCAVRPSFLREVLEQVAVANFEPRFRAGFRDEALSNLCDLLLDELLNPSASSRLYVECLAHALATRYIAVNQSPAAPASQGAARLSDKATARVREKIEASLNEDISVDSLAAETGYSRAHFLRLFSATTGLTPHQYVLQSRLSRAKQLITAGDAEIIDIALECGFSSQSHMTTLFRQKLGVTPAEFRRCPGAAAYSTPHHSHR